MIKIKCVLHWKFTKQFKIPNYKITHYVNYMLILIYNKQIEKVGKIRFKETYKTTVN